MCFFITRHVVEYAFLRGEGFYYFLFLTNWSLSPGGIVLGPNSVEPQCPSPIPSPEERS